MIFLIAALFTGLGAMDRFDQGKTDSAWALVAITIALILGAIIVSISRRD